MAMRNAERFIAQGKIRSAIDEYNKVVRHDPRDFGTLNMLGDLHVKESNTNEAVRCYTSVAEYYSKQGFAQKAIAIYNKIARLKPDSPEISEKLAELYKSKGSISEAKSHYTTLAEHYMSNGYRMEALAIWKQIGLLDPNNTSVYINLAEAFLAENELDEAAEAYGEAAERFARAADHQAAVDSLTKALAINPSNVNCLNSFVRELDLLGRGDEALEKLEQLLKSNPHNRDLARLLIDCHIRSNRPDQAEAVLIKLVEQEPANFNKFLELVAIYLERSEAAAASRALSMCAEHLLMGGHGQELETHLGSILSIDAKDLAALRMRARFYSWKRDKDGLTQALTNMASVAKDAGSVDDERYALSQLTMIVPHQTDYSDRLDAINEEHGFEENPFDETILQEQFGDETAELTLDDDLASTSLEAIAAELEIVREGDHSSSNGHVDVAGDGLMDAELERFSAEVADANEEEILAPTPETLLEKELESIRFYIENEYFELAQRTLGELRERFGELPEFEALDIQLGGAVADQTSGARPLDLAEIRNEFGIDDIVETPDDGDYDTHYQLATAYQEMGLLEEAIKEYQDAINLVRPNDSTRRFFHCANLLGHCFMQKEMANLALTWYRRALETPELSADERQAMWYEIAQAYEAEGDIENAGRYFEQVYAENVDYRDVGERIKRLAVQAA